MVPPPQAPGGEYAIPVVLDNLLRKPKGVQGWIAIGALDRRLQHYRLEYRNTLKEHEVTFARGLLEPHRGGPGTPATFTSEALHC